MPARYSSTLHALITLVALLVTSVLACANGGGASFATDGGPDATLGPTGDGGDCAPKTCAQLGYTCGKNADGCGHLIDCGSCASPQFCGGAGFSQCGGDLMTDAGGNSCTPATCAAQGYTCGQNADGCGNIVDCGTCTAPAFCGAGGFSVCGGNSIAVDSGGSVCVPTTCAQLGYSCGSAGDGCGHMLDCGTCKSPAFCGGGGFNLCGGNIHALDGGSVCVPTTCGALGYSCGPAGDGCGNMLDCGDTCPFPTFCGGAGFSKCGGNVTLLDGGPPCMPKTCSDVGLDCGPADDGCGNLIQCGSCQAPQICGGGGHPGVCGDSACTGLCLDQVQCDGGGTTTFTGQVVAGTQAPYGDPDPVPNVVVYVPNGTVTPFSQGVQCSQCGADVSGNPLVQTTTDYAGHFTLQNIPVPPNGQVLLVIQLGRWRKKVTFPVTACATSDVGQITMPHNHIEGDIPFTAISTGQYDAMECVLLKMGVDSSEFTQPGGGGRIEMYQGNGVDDGPGTPAESKLTGSSGTVLDKYDQVLFPCWGRDPRPSGLDYDGTNIKTAAEQQNLIQYTTNGGRVFATHYSYAWLYDVSPFMGTATWVPDDEPTTATANILQSPTDVGTFYQWMNAISGGATAGQFTLNAPRYNFSAVSATSELWVNATAPQGPYETDAQAPAPASFPVLYTFDTPLTPATAPKCGRVVFSAFHVTVVSGGSDHVTDGESFPTECTPTPMSPQEKALEYAIWDLASCVPGPPAPPHCTQQSCQQQNIGCGPAGDGCGGQIDCGQCTAPQTCGGGGQFAQCGAADGGFCTPLTCTQQSLTCGPAGDGCGHSLSCGSCTLPQTCGGGGQPGQCGFTDGGHCGPETCADQHITCGPAGDGCGGTLDCGSCTAPQTCGGAGQPGQCGDVDGGSCTPKTCAQENIACGPAGDGCGGLLQCGSCAAPQTCGGGGKPGVCGAVDAGTGTGNCAPKTCQTIGYECGSAGDGCGGLLNCGGCITPETCGGSGKAGVCGKSK